MAKEPYEIRRQMADMHDEFLDRLSHAIDEEAYVEAAWLCYSIFEQRTNRIVEKYISECPKEKRLKKGNPIKISTKLHCIRKLIEKQYDPFAGFDMELINEIQKWCKARNELVHGLVSLEHYKKYDEEFEMLAKSGAPLVKRMYGEATRIREWYRNENNQMGTFPVFRCKCEKRCIIEKE